MIEEIAPLLLPTLAATLRVATPLILCALAGLFSERSGVIDIGLEGKLLAGAFAAAAAAAVTGSAWAGLAVAVLTTVAMALVHGFASITQRGNQLVSGIALNVIAAGLTALLGAAWFQRGGQTPPLPTTARFLPISPPAAQMIGDWPLLGPLWTQLIAAQGLLVYATLALVPLAAWGIGGTRFGFRLRAAGDNPQAVAAAGIDVAGLRYRALLVGGVLTGIAGTYLALGQNAGFSRDMSAGQGYIALAALVFGKWRVWPTFGACLLFGLLDAVAIRLQGVRIAGLGELPVPLIQALPFGLTVVLLAGLIGRAIPPRALGTPDESRR